MPAVLQGPSKLIMLLMHSCVQFMSMAAHYCRFPIATQIAGVNQVPNALQQAGADALRRPDAL